MKTKALHNQLIEWRQDLHMNPQIGFEEEYASKKVASLLASSDPTFSSTPKISAGDRVMDRKASFHERP